MSSYRASAMSNHVNTLNIHLRLITKKNKLLLDLLNIGISCYFVRTMAKAGWLVWSIPFFADSPFKQACSQATWFWISGTVHTYLELFASSNFFIQIHLASTCVRRIRSVYPEISVYALQSGNFWIRCVSGYMWTLVSVYFCIHWRHSIRTSLFPHEICWLILWDVRIQIG